ncbi:MAG: hypothetical protein F6J98_15260 [Moorea sp. SIO4G2]|nr:MULTISPECIES: hypothetical protein [unclassified Moorena]NEO10756.1 hypothetical protein [Moorena sp. SIO3I8]NEO61714.1 hypothetical protein [Moorena sp. SIO4G2]NEO14263.1 hypothetical protein [Moorena sp. SIO3E8]NEO24288.1 hypothetical protein [Moorena sp. SIO4A5]NEO76426.1 hypothetical protein [Moorena sp. SIO4G3]
MINRRVGSAYQGDGKQRNLSKALPTVVARHELSATRLINPRVGSGY